jgi:branched-chain amino acid aminotransferase
LSVVWLNGALLEAGAARIDPADRGFTLGDGLFETIRVQDGMPAYLQRHLARLASGAAVLGLPVPFSDYDLTHAMLAVLQANALTQAALRLTVTRGPAPRGVAPPAAPAPTVLITAGALPAPAGPASLAVATLVRRNEFSALSGIKSLNYLDSILARQEANARGFDDAILLNTQGFAAETTAASLFLLIDGIWHTPRISDGALPGIMRGVILDNRAVHETRIGTDLLAGVTAAFLANSLGYRAVSRLDARRLDTAAIGALRLGALF